MVNILGRGLAGMGGGIGLGLVQRAEIMREEAIMANREKARQAERLQDRAWQIEDRDFAAYLRGRGSSRARSGGGRSGAGGGAGGGGSPTGLMPGLRDPMAPAPMDGSYDPNGFDTFGYGEPTAGSDAAPAANLPRRAGPDDDLVNRFKAEEGSWRAFTKGSNEEVLLSDPKAEDSEQASIPPYLPKRKTESPEIGDPPGRGEPAPEVGGDKKSPYFQPEKGGHGKPGGLMPQDKGDTVPEKNAPPATENIVGLEPAEVKPLSASSIGRLERSMRDQYGRNVDPVIFSNIVDEIETEIANGSSEAKATKAVLSRLERETPEPNPPGTKLSRFLGLTSRDDPPDNADQIEKAKTSGPIKGLMPSGTAPAAKRDAVAKAPPAPRNVAERVAGKVYTAPDGRRVKWTGEGWILVNG